VTETLRFTGFFSIKMYRVEC